MSDLVQQTRARQQQGKTIQQMLTPVKGSLGNALAERIGVERFMQAAVTTFRKTPGLARCTEESILGGLFVAAQLGLEVGGPRGLAYLVPYGSEATLVLGYRGIVELMYRTGQVQKVDAFLVREHDVFRQRWDPQHGRVFDWEPGAQEAKPVGAVAYAVMTNGGLIWQHMTEEQILKRRPAKWTNTPWATWPDEMWLKTVLKALPRTVRTSSDDLSLAIEADQTVQRRIPGVEHHVVARVPVEGAQAEAPTARDAVEAAPAAAEPVEEPAVEADAPMALAVDEQAAFEEQSRREYEDYLASQQEDA